MSAAVDIVQVVVIIMGLGVAAQVIADRLRIPSVVFLIVAGVVVGPEGLGLVSPEIFGDGLQAIVGLSVAVIVFEGAFHLRIDRIRGAQRETLQLITFGALGSLLGTAVVVHYVLGVPWDVAFLVGSLLIATGPTVITPILSVVPVRERVASTLETEGVVNDVTAAILAIAMFEYVLLGSEGLATLVREFALRFGLGILVGTTVAAVLWVVLRYGRQAVENAPQNARLMVLVSSLTMYGVAEVLGAAVGASEAGSHRLNLGSGRRTRRRARHRREPRSVTARWNYSTSTRPTSERTPALPPRRGAPRVGPRTRPRRARPGRSAPAAVRPGPGVHGRRPPVDPVGPLLRG